MCCIGKCTGSLSQHMNHPVLRLPFSNECIQCPCGIPHQIASGFIVFRILHCYAGGMDNRAHEPLCQIITGVIIISGEILFTDMIKHIINTGNHLILRHRHGKFRIQDGETRHNFFTKYMADFQFLLMIGNNRACIHFRACSYHSKHTSYRYNFTIRLFHFQEILIPWIPIIMNRYRKCFGIITTGTAAYSQNKIYVGLSCNLYPIFELVSRRIGHDPGNFSHFFSCFFQDIHNLVINTISLDGAAPVYQYHMFPISGQFAREKRKCIFSKIQFGWVNIRKIT